MYLYNKTSHINIDFKTSYELKYGRIPNFKNIKIWNFITCTLINKSKKLSFKIKYIINVKFNESSNSSSEYFNEKKVDATK